MEIGSYLPSIGLLISLNFISIIRLTLEVSHYSSKKLGCTSISEYVMQYVDAIFEIICLVFFGCYISKIAIKSILISLAPKLISLITTLMIDLVLSVLEEGENMARAFRISFKISILLMLSTVGLKIDSFIHWEWFKVLWALWIITGLYSLLLIGFFGALIANIFRYIMNREVDRQEVLSFFWFNSNLFTMVVLGLVEGFLFENFIQNNFNDLLFGIYCVVASAATFILSVFTLCYKKDLAVFMVAVTELVKDKRSKRR